MTIVCSSGFRGSVQESTFAPAYPRKRKAEGHTQVNGEFRSAERELVKSSPRGTCTNDPEMSCCRSRSRTKRHLSLADPKFSNDELDTRTIVSCWLFEAGVKFQQGVLNLFDQLRWQRANFSRQNVALDVVLAREAVRLGSWRKEPPCVVETPVLFVSLETRHCCPTSPFLAGRNVPYSLSEVQRRP